MAELTLFATPKPFRDSFARIQTNAIRSWAALGAGVEVILIGDDEGVAAAAATFGVRHVPEVARSPKNVPLLDDLWRIGQSEASSPTCLFANADIVFTDDLGPAIEAIGRTIDGPYLVVGQRWDLELDADLDTSKEDWGAVLRRRARECGRLNSPLWVDWFAFPRGQYPDLPPFIIGRPGYDHWLVWHTLTRGIPVIDATHVVTAVHQHHDYSHGGNHQSVWFGDDAQTNRALLGDRAQMRHIGHATHRLHGDLTLAEARGAKYILSGAHRRLAPMLERTMRVRHHLGMDAEHLQAAAMKFRRG